MSLSEQLAIGIPNEMKEHNVSEDYARKIAMDHLREDPEYYSKLKLIEGNDMEFKDVLARGRKVEDGPYKHSKMRALDNLQKAMGDDMAEDVRGLKKVSVAAPSKEGLSQGLDKAQELLGADEGGKNIVEEAAEGISEAVSEGSELGPKEGLEENHEVNNEDLASKVAEIEKQLAELKARMQ